MLIALLLGAIQPAFAAGPRVDIVIGEKAPPLEKRAADDIAADLKKVYDAEVKIATAAPEGAENVIFVGSPESNEETKKRIEESWPKLSEQGHVLRTFKYLGKPALFVGGGSSRATYWAAAEFAHSLGIRSLLYADLYPISPKPFSLDGYDVVLELPSRTWRSECDPFPTGFTAWGLQDYKRMLRQRARLKDAGISLTLHSWQPFVDFEVDGVKKETAVLWYGWRFPVSGDTAGRAAFGGAKIFENPDYADAKSYEKRVQIGKRWLTGLIDEAHSLGMSVDVEISPSEFPREFAKILPGTAPTEAPSDLAVRSLEKRKSKEQLTNHEKIQIEAFKATYPGIDEINFERSIAISHVYPALVADSNLAAYQFSRTKFGESPSFEETCGALVTPICGDGVSISVFKAAEPIISSIMITRENDKFFSMPAPDLILKHYASSDPPPEWWSKVRDNYLGAMNDMYRANSRAREGGRSYTLYLARRCEFGYEYMNCVEATRMAGIARSKKDTAEQRAQLEKAIESMNAACSALAAVSRDQSDRGMIAVCNEFGYKALQKELEKLDAE